MRTLILLTLAAATLLAVPPAAADENLSDCVLWYHYDPPNFYQASACVSEYEYGSDPGCAAPNSQYSGQDFASAGYYLPGGQYAGVGAGGFRSCYNDPATGQTYRDEALYVVVGTSIASEQVVWRERTTPSGTSCNTSSNTTAPFGRADFGFGCPAGAPPDVPWGNVIP